MADDRTIKGLFIDTKNNLVKEVEFTTKEDIANIIGSDDIGYPMRRLGHRNFQVSYNLKEQNPDFPVTIEGDPNTSLSGISGNVLITGQPDGWGNMTDISENLKDEIMGNMDFSGKQPVLKNCTHAQGLFDE